ncbi:GP102 [Caviid betaherpesvirus 2]|uniref:GP102 n=1 Tax=Guinea pig cytomegalovirus (strain 22122) TaxID=103920 RepID=B7TQ04_GPCMV|nr:GP102 [Caviid betaherpesvirus 2]AGE11572.1 GP102 [Caviid betaherpesvirus 2]AIL83960.1 GP102 [BAC cloning vector GPN13BACdenovo_preserved(MM)]BAJ78560.1 GP102 [Caviid betaherpesvirus 2]
MASVLRHYTGVVCHLGLYGIKDDRPILQCLFMDMVGGDGPHLPILKSFVVLGDPIADADAVRVLRRPFDSYVRDVQRHVEFVAAKSSLLSNVLLRRGGLVSTLSRPFLPVTVGIVQPDDCIIASAERARPVRGFEDFVSAFKTARLAVVGEYSFAGADCDRQEREPQPPSKTTRSWGGTGGGGRADVEADAGQGKRRAETSRDVSDRQTQTVKKIRRGYSADSVTFSIRVGDKRYLFDTSNRGRWPVSALFSVEDHSLDVRDSARKLRIRLVTPRGFIALAFSDEQCILLLRTALKQLFEHIYADFSGVRPLFDYLGPDLFQDGFHSKSVFYTGFPNVCMYAVPGADALGRETSLDAMKEIVSCCGLPDVLGEDGKLTSGLNPDSGLSPAVSAAFPDAGDVRINGSRFVTCDFAFPADVSPADDACQPTNVQLYLSRGCIRRLTIPDFRWKIMKKCLVDGEFPFPLGLGPDGRRDRRELCHRFVSRLRGAASREILAVESFISHHVTAACTSSNLAWLLVRNGCEFFVEEDRSDFMRSETCLNTVMSCYWKKCFGGSASDDPVCNVTGRYEGAVILADGLLLVSGEAHPLAPDGSGTPGWRTVMADVSTSIVDETKANAIERLFGSDYLKNVLRSMMLRLAARRNDTAFWIERFQPGVLVREHPGLLDCAPFCGVWGSSRMAVVQPRDAALSDTIDYSVYVRRIVRCVRACVTVLVLRDRGERSCSVAGGAADPLVGKVDRLFRDVERELLRDYLCVFRIN